MLKMRMAIEGLGVVGGFGCGLEALQEALDKGRVEPSRAVIETDMGQKEIPVFLAETTRLEEFFQKRKLRRIDHHSKLALLTASMALKDAGRFGEDQSRTGVVVATGYGPLGTTYAFLDAFSSPTHFASSVHNVAAAYAAIFLKATGPSLTVSQFDMSVSSALLTAWCWLRDGCVDRVLFGAVDDYSAVLGYCYHRFFSLGDNPDVPMEPLSFGKQTAIPGEGSAFFVLSRDEAQTKYGCITGVANGVGVADLPAIPQDQPLIIGADGHGETGHHYGALTVDRDVTCFSPFYGSLPTGQAFDMAAALLSPDSETISSLLCLKISGKGEIGLIRMGKILRGRR